MVLESTVVCVDASDFMRNGDFVPSRLQAQQDAVSVVFHSKIRSNPENCVALVTLSKPQVLTTLTSDAGRILSKLHQLQPQGNLSFVTGIRIAHLVLRHRQGKNHKMRIVAFVGSPVEDEETDIIKLAKKLKKEKVNVDIINFGEDCTNTDKMTTFINTINGKDGTGCHLVTVPPGPHLSDALITSPVIQGEDGTGAVGLGGAGYEFGFDPNDDPELALALRVSMEEQRQRQEEEAKRVTAESAAEVPGSTAPDAAKENAGSEEAMLEKALEMSLAAETSTPKAAAIPDFASMTEDEQIAYAMQMSLQQSQQDQEQPMETDDPEIKKEESEDYSEVMNDPEFLQSVLQNLPGVDPQSEAIRNAMGSLNQERKKDGENQDEKKN